MFFAYLSRRCLASSEQVSTTTYTCKRKTTHVAIHHVSNLLAYPCARSLSRTLTYSHTHTPSHTHTHTHSRTSTRMCVKRVEERAVARQPWASILVHAHILATLADWTINNTKIDCYLKQQAYTTQTPNNVLCISQPSLFGVV